MVVMCIHCIPCSNPPGFEGLVFIHTFYIFPNMSPDSLVCWMVAQTYLMPEAYESELGSKTVVIWNSCQEVKKWFMWSDVATTTVVYLTSYVPVVYAYGTGCSMGPHCWCRKQSSRYWLLGTCNQWQMYIDLVLLLAAVCKPSMNFMYFTRESRMTIFEPDTVAVVCHRARLFVKKSI